MIVLDCQFETGLGEGREIRRIGRTRKRGRRLPFGGQSPNDVRSTSSRYGRCRPDRGVRATATQIRATIGVLAIRCAGRASRPQSLRVRDFLETRERARAPPSNCNTLHGPQTIGLRAVIAAAITNHTN